jgi:hypothetical protein
MASGIPVRLSEQLAMRARAAAVVEDRSLTEQVEHWARLGQAVEDAVLAATVKRLKARSHDRELAGRLAFASSPAGQAAAAKVIADRNVILHELDSDGRVRARRGKRRRAGK